MIVDNQEVENHIAVQDCPTECSYHPIFNEAMIRPERKGDFWADLIVNWVIFAKTRWN